MEFTPRFITNLYLKDNEDRTFTLTSPLTYVTNVKNMGTLSVPTGFTTDLASIPRGLWNIFSPIGSYDSAAVVHDFLYKTGQFNGSTISRSTADSILKEAMQVSGVRWWTRNAIYLGVRVGGWVPWQHYRRDSAGV